MLTHVTVNNDSPGKLFTAEATFFLILRLFRILLRVKCIQRGEGCSRESQLANIVSS